MVQSNATLTDYESKMCSSNCNYDSESRENITHFLPVTLIQIGSVQYSLSVCKSHIYRTQYVLVTHADDLLCLQLHTVRASNQCWWLAVPTAAHSWVTILFRTLEVFIWTSMGEPQLIFLYQLSKSSTTLALNGMQHKPTGAALLMCWSPCHLIGVNKVNGWTTHSCQYEGQDPEVTCQRRS